MSEKVIEKIFLSQSRGAKNRLQTKIYANEKYRNETKLSFSVPTSPLTVFGIEIPTSSWLRQKVNTESLVMVVAANEIIIIKKKNKK
jgi:hypothetical protein